MKKIALIGFALYTLLAVAVYHLGSQSEDNIVIKGTMAAPTYLFAK